MEQSDLLRKIAETFDKLAIRYVVVGSTASILHGEARNTNDIDVVIELTPEKLAMLKTTGDRIDRQYGGDWAKRLGLTPIWSDILARLEAG
jgi:predicted nucleotidyltransferase